MAGRWEIELWAPIVLLLPASSAVAVASAPEVFNISHPQRVPTGATAALTSTAVVL